MRPEITRTTGIEAPIAPGLPGPVQPRRHRGYVIRFNAAETPDRFVPLALAAGLPAAGMPGEEAGYLLADLVRAVGDRLGIPRGLASLGVSETDVDTLAKNALEDACLATNPRPTSQQDLAALFRAAL